MPVQVRFQVRGGFQVPKRLILMVMLEEAPQAIAGIGNNLLSGEEYQTEVIRCRPVEACALNNKHFFLPEEI